MTIKSKKKGAKELSEKEALALAKVLGDVEELDPQATADTVETDKTLAATEVTPEPVETTTPEPATSDFMALVQNYATAKAEVAAQKIALAELAKEKTLLEVKLVNLTADAETVAKAASHSCMIYASQLGKPMADYEKMSTTILATQFVSLRKEFTETFPQGQNSGNPEEESNSPSASSNNIHPISTARSSR